MFDIIDFLRLNLLVSFPQTFVYWVFCFSFLENRPPQLIKRILVLAVIHSIYTDILILVLPLHLHLINTVTAGFILLIVIFKEIKLKLKFYLMLFSLILSVVMDMITLSAAIYVLGISSHSDMIREHLYQIITVVYPELLILLLASKVIRKRNLPSAKKIFSIIMEKERRPLTMVSVFISLQFILLGVLQLMLFTPEKHNLLLNAIIIYLTILVSLLALVSIIRLLVRTREQAAKSTQEVYIDDINDMFTSIRGQRHDFLNHVQVIHTMVQMGRTEQLKTYVGDLVKETRDVSDIVHHSSPALAAFIQAKTAVSIGKGIEFTYELPAKWDTGETTVKVIDIIKIMGNLVDNAFDEAMNLPQQERSVFASIRVLEDGSIELQVSNRGRSLTAHDRQLIFKPGYTTKGEGHSGLGLAIVQERVKHYKGSLDLVSDEGEGLTTFKVYLPEISA